MMQYRSLELADVKLLIPNRHQDERGFFREVFRQSEFEAQCGRFNFVQDNFSRSYGGTLRGLHYQANQPQGKLVQVMSGRIFDVAVDIRSDSATCGCWVGQVLTAEHGEQMWIPPGFAHGFYLMSEMADVFYKCTDYYLPGDERVIRWDSPQLAINWPLSTEWPIGLSDKDRHADDFYR